MQTDRQTALRQFTHQSLEALPIYPTPSQMATLRLLDERARATGATGILYGLRERCVIVSITLAPHRFAYFIVGVRGNVAEYRPAAGKRAPYIRPSRRKRVTNSCVS